MTKIQWRCCVCMILFLLALALTGCAHTPKQRHSGSVVMPDGTVRSTSVLKVVPK